MPAAKYLDIAASLEREVRSMAPGARLPGEHEIVQRFAVARSTARAALKHLETRNVIRRVRGSGSFAIRRVDYLIDADRAPSWSRTVRAAGAVPRSVVRSCTAVRPPEHVREKLELAAEEPCHRLVRLSYANGEPAAWGIEWVPVSALPGLPDFMRATESLHEVLREAAGFRPRRVWVRASAENLGEEVAAQFGVPATTLGWYVESLNCDAGSARSLSLTQRWIRADIVRVVLDSRVGRAGPG